MIMQEVYLDNAATTKMRNAVVLAITETMQKDYGNPSSSYRIGRKAKSLIETSRKIIAKLLNATSGEFYFTSGGTEANNWALRSAVKDLGVKHIISTKIEHHAVLRTIEALKEEYKIEVTYLNVNEVGTIDIVQLERLLQSTPNALVSLMHVNNEVGTILDLNRVGALCRANNALFHTDAVQSIGHIPLDLNNLEVDFLTASSHKFHGPKGVGFLYIKKTNVLKPLVYGGEQERGLRAGTEALYNIVGLGKALALAYSNLEQETETLRDLKSYFITQLYHAIPNIAFNGLSEDLAKTTHTILNVRFPVTASQTELFLFQLDLKGIACSKGSACQSGSTVKSHVLNEILDPEALEQLSIRFSLSIFNTKADIDYTVQVLKSLIK